MPWLCSWTRSDSIGCLLVTCYFGRTSLMCLCRGSQCCSADFSFSGPGRKYCLELENSGCMTSHFGSCWRCSCPCLTAGSYYFICCTGWCSCFSASLDTQHSEPCCCATISDYCCSLTPRPPRVRSTGYFFRDCQPCRTWSGNCCGTLAA